MDNHDGPSTNSREKLKALGDIRRDRTVGMPQYPEGGKKSFVGKPDSPLDTNGRSGKEKYGSSPQSSGQSASDSTVLDEEAMSLDQLQRKKEGSSSKRDRSKLRKGKWTLEEEEYTSRIIHYFNSGLLTLPADCTLRSYLAEKLNCDPMRITKKYAGAACLGRRAHHFRDVAEPTIAEVQLAKAQLDELEHRFRLRVEEGYSGPPPPPVSSQATQFIQPGPGQIQSAASLQSWLQLLAGAQTALLSAPNNAQPSSWNNAPPTLNPLVVNPTNGSWILPNVPAPTVAQPHIPHPIPSQNLDLATLSRLALSQVASSLLPALSQLAATANLPSVANGSVVPSINNSQVYGISSGQGHAIQGIQSNSQTITGSNPNQQPVATQTIPHDVKKEPSANVCGKQQIQLYADQLKRAYELSVGTQRKSVVANGDSNGQPIGTQKTSLQTPLRHTTNIGSTSVVTGNCENASPEIDVPRTDDEQQAGTMLLGFLTSLRQSYLDAVHETTQSDSKDHTPQVTIDRRVTELRVPSRAPTTVTDSSSLPVDSSMEDSDYNSDKKTDPSSSEESDKEMINNAYNKRAHPPDDNGVKNLPIRLSKGPPRKRLKGMHLSES